MILALLVRLRERLRREWHQPERLHMKRLAERYYLRAQMDGHVIRRTGEIVSKESV